MRKTRQLRLRQGTDSEMPRGTTIPGETINICDQLGLRPVVLHRMVRHDGNCHGWALDRHPQNQRHQPFLAIAHEPANAVSTGSADGAAMGGGK